MPQFDFFIWFSLSSGTIITFQILYYILLYYILAPFSNLQKTLIKLYHLKQLQKGLVQTSIFEYFIKIYFQNLKKENILNTTNSLNKANSKLDLKLKTNIIKKKNILFYQKKNTKNINLKKTDILFKTLEKKFNIFSFYSFILAKKKVQKKKINKKKKNKKKTKNTKKAKKN
jgi:hypothetical protein